MILLLDNYDSFTYNLAQYLGQMGQTLEVRRNDQITLDEIEILQPERIVISPGTVTKELDDLTILLNLRTGGSYRLNHTGAQMFALMKRTTTPRRIATTIAAQYGVARQDVERDSSQLFEDLAAHDLIRIVR